MLPPSWRTTEPSAPTEGCASGPRPWGRQGPRCRQTCRRPSGSRGNVPRGGRRCTQGGLAASEPATFAAVPASRGPGAAQTSRGERGIGGSVRPCRVRVHLRVAGPARRSRGENSSSAEPSGCSFAKPLDQEPNTNPRCSGASAATRPPEYLRGAHGRHARRRDEGQAPMVADAWVGRLESQGEVPGTIHLGVAAAARGNRSRSSERGRGSRNAPQRRSGREAERCTSRGTPAAPARTSARVGFRRPIPVAAAQAARRRRRRPCRSSRWCRGSSKRRFASPRLVAQLREMSRPMADLMETPTRVAASRASRPG
jgi:hypothetical protein